MPLRVCADKGWISLMDIGQQLRQAIGIEKPIVQAPMAGAQDWRLAVAVSQAGGLGSIPCGMLTREQVLTEINQFRQHSNKPYNLNFFCHQMPTVDTVMLQHWQAKLARYYQHYQLQANDEISGLRVPFDQAMADMLEPIKPPVVSFHFGLPHPDLVAQIKTWGTTILSSATTVEEAIWLQKRRGYYHCPRLRGRRASCDVFNRRPQHPATDANIAGRDNRRGVCSSDCRWWSSDCC